MSRPLSSIFDLHSWAGATFSLLQTPRPSARWRPTWGPLFSLATFALLLVCTPASAWEEIHRVDGIRVLSQDRAGSKYEELKAEATLRGVPAEKAFAVVSDPDLYLKLIPNLSEAKVLKKTAAGCIRMYQRFNAPFPLSDRDYIVDLCDKSLTKNGKKIHRLVWTAADDASIPPKKGVVRVSKTEGHWILVATEDGKSTQAEYYVYADLGGKVPSSLVNQVSAYELPTIIDKLTALAK